MGVALSEAPALARGSLAGARDDVSLQVQVDLERMGARLNRVCFFKTGQARLSR